MARTEVKQKTEVEGQLEVDHDRGVIYFHAKTGVTMLRVNKLPRPIPRGRMLDITAMAGTICNWKGVG